MNEPTEEDLAADAEYVRGYVNCAEIGLRMHACDATYRLQRASRIAEAAIRRALAAEAETKRLQGIIEGLADRVAAQSALLSRRAEGAPPRDDVRALVVEIRRFVIAHGVLLGECVAWDHLKKLVGVGQDHNCPSEK